MSVIFENVSLNISGRSILESITCEFADRSLSVVFGPNGAGKTCLLKLLIGQIVPSSGQIKLFAGTVEQNRNLIGYVPQSIFRRRNIPLTVLKTVLMGRYGKIGLFHRAKTADLELAQQALKTVGLENFDQRYISDLSGGQRQRVFIARALASQPRLLLLDEATSGVDVGAKESLYDLLLRLKEQMSIIFVTHDMSVISKGVDSVLCLNKKMVSHGRPEQALNAEVLKCMYGDGVAVLSHCQHVHLEGHE